MLYIYFLFVATGKLQAQSSVQIRSDCQQERNELSNKITTLNNEYELIKEDLKAGLFCSKCGSSKTELDKLEGFYKHLNNVKGEPIAATQAQMAKAYEKYLNKFNSLKSQLEQKDKSCNERVNSAVKSENDKLNRDRENAIKEQQDRVHEAAQEAERQQKAELQRQEQLRQEIERQKEVQRQQLVAESQQRQTQANQMFNETANNLKNQIGNIKMPDEKIRFPQGGKTTTGSSDNDYAAASAKKDLDDFDLGVHTNSLLSDALDNLFGETTDFIVEELIEERVKNDVMKDLYRSAYEKYNQIKDHWGIVDDMRNGTITTQTTDAIFSHTANPIIRKIQQASGAVAITQRDAIIGSVDRIFQEDLTDLERDQAFNETVRDLNPFRKLTTFSKENKEWTVKDYAKAGVFCVVGGVAITAGLPVWAGIGAAAWYGFTR